MCVCVGQVVCDKGLGMKGMTLTSLKEEGFKAAFIGIGKDSFQNNDCCLNLSQKTGTCNFSSLFIQFDEY